jgi:hypothetical protein
MFEIVLSTATKTPMPSRECLPIFKGMVNLWKSNPEICRSILADDKLPTCYKSTEVPDQLDGLSYELEPKDFPALYQVCLDTAPTELDTEEVHKVYRLVKKTGKAYGLQVPNKRSHLAVWYHSRMTGAMPVERRVQASLEGFVPFTHDLVVENLAMPKK